MPSLSGSAWLREEMADLKQTPVLSGILEYFNLLVLVSFLIQIRTASGEILDNMAFNAGQFASSTPAGEVARDVRYRQSLLRED